jgi:hypothetical protein
MYPQRTHASEMLDTLGWLNVSKRTELHQLSLVYKCVNNITTPVFNDLFQSSQSLQLTRASISHNLMIPRVKTNSGKRTFQFTGAKLWNSQSVTTETSSSLASLKNNFIKDLQGNI